MKRKIICISIVSMFLLTSLTTVLAVELESIGITQSEKKDADNIKVLNEGFEDYYAVIIGISDYKGSLNDLINPALEANKMKNVLCEHGWNEENIHLITNKEANRANILSELTWLSEKPGTSLFYFAGHGSQIKDENGDEGGIDLMDECIVPWECSKDTMILDDELEVIFNGFKADKIVSIFISCFSGGLIEDENKETSRNIKAINIFLKRFPRICNIFMKSAMIKNMCSKAIGIKSEGDIEKELEIYQPMEELHGANRVIITACQENMQTYEFPIFGQPFAVWILQSLSGGIFNGSSPDTNDDNFITAEEAFNFARPRAVLETATLLGYPAFAIYIIKEWIKGNLGLLEVLYGLGLLGLMIPVPQIYDGNPNEDIILTSVS